MDDPAGQARDGNGKYEYVNTAVQRDADAASLKAQGKTYQQIADILGYCDRGHAWRGVQRAKQAVLREPAERLIQVEAEQLDELYVAALAVLERDHIVVSHGQIVRDEEGHPLLDDGPKLAAIRELRTLRESYRKLYGLDAEKKVNVSGGVRYEIVGIDSGDLS
ncbi:hypothetical protein ACFWG0_26350 [Streptomyces yangpuensis]|uniref:hypothetical protein n=1 Tax=Streptomyces yangpuensis TaxID=1648182 RepID=UPI00364BF25F